MEEKDTLAALRKLAEGYEYEEREIIVDRNGQATGKVRIRKKYMPPSMEAIRLLMFLEEEVKR